jgi:hypothetical protein
MHHDSWKRCGSFPAWQVMRLTVNAIIAVSPQVLNILVLLFMVIGR